MNEPARASAQVALPEWYARFAPGQAVPPAEDGSLRLGPLSIYRAACGCQIAGDGPPGHRVDVLFDGYLFDRAALAREFGLREGREDATLAAHAYRKWGAGLFDRLDGCYLIGVWDEAADRLTIGHDALGRHPVFYAQNSNELWFGSNLLALAANGHVSRRPNRLSFALGMVLYWPETGETFFDAIHRVRPGHYLDVDARLSVRQHKYWEPIPPDEEPWLTEQDVHTQFEPALLGAVSRCMELEPRGIMLSGGVDSVTVAALAAQCSPRGASDLVAVCARTGGPLSYEEEMQSLVIDRLRMPSDFSTTEQWKEGRDGIELSLELVPQLPGPDSTWWVGTYTRFYRRAARQRLSVLLTGAGGDNWLGVADTHAADLIGRLDLPGWMRLVQSNLSTGGASLRSALARLVWSGGARPHVDTLLTRVLPGPKLQYHRRKWRDRLPRWLCPDARLREELIEHLLGRRSPGLTPAGRRPVSYYRHYLRSLENPYLHHENETAFHIENWCGLRLLSPYHDRRLVSFLNRINPETLLHGRRYKGLLRPVVGRYLPGLGLEDQRKHYPRAEQEQKLRDLRKSVSAAWARAPLSLLDSLGIVRASAARDGIDLVSDHGFRPMGQAFTLMSAERWVQDRVTV